MAYWYKYLFARICALAAADEKQLIGVLYHADAMYSHRTLLTLLHCALSKAPLIHSNLTTGTDCNINISIEVATDNIEDDLMTMIFPEWKLDLNIQYIIGSSLPFIRW